MGVKSEGPPFKGSFVLDEGGILDGRIDCPAHNHAVHCKLLFLEKVRWV